MPGSLVGMFSNFCVIVSCLDHDIICQIKISRNVIIFDTRCLGLQSESSVKRHLCQFASETFKHIKHKIN